MLHFLKKVYGDNEEEPLVHINLFTVILQQHIYKSHNELMTRMMDGKN